MSQQGDPCLPVVNSLLLVRLKRSLREDIGEPQLRERGKMAEKAIPDKVRRKVEEIVQRFNKEVLGDPDCYYVTRYRGKFLYLERNDYGRFGPICRLEYTGKMDEWEFAIYKYSSERYDPDEWFFYGSHLVDGTIEGALRAGMEAYPP